MSLPRRVIGRVRRELQGPTAVLQAQDIATPDNRPQGMQNPRIPAFGDTLQQMAFGERLALEGILAQLRPALSIEIGTHSGGSLRSIARYSDEVHAIDLHDFVADKSSLTNVTFHYGDSKVLVPQVLEQFAAAGRVADFVLVDGDHSAKGVKSDFMNLLASPACGRTVILAHDTMNEQVRAGIDGVGLADHPSVVYVELDVVPGYKHATGGFAGRYFGGLGLVITGDRDADGYGHQPLQTCYASAFDLMHGRSAQVS